MQSEATTPRVLLVDDDIIVLELVSLMLAAQGIEVVRACGGPEGLQALQGMSPLPDVVLVDYQMPELNGADLARYIKSLPEPRPRVIGMSASPLPPGDLAQFDQFLPKPLDQDLLQAAIAGTATPKQTTPSTALPAALDPATLQKLQALMPPQALRELFTVYVDDTRGRIAELERCNQTGDSEAFRRCAHALKGAASMAGVPGIAAIAARLEAGQVSYEEYERLFQQMRNACDDVERSMTIRAVSGEA
jgi:CheY-like chemotaxis protein/HPt (histidine-containing phosphotransfer) domain-containing protein